MTRVHEKGFSLVEMIVVSALMVLVFGSLLLSFKYTFELINATRAKLSALSIANDRMEYFRSLPYDEVGTISGIPSGTIPQNSTTTLNDIEFAERVLVEYVDDIADGQDVADSNGIPSDYKRLKLEYTWEINGATTSIALISNIVPRSIETTAGGGTVRINVIDDQSALLPGASVRLVNASATAPIDVTRITDVNGVALFSGAPADSNYEVIVTANISGDQYSTDQTYKATTSIPNPLVAPFAVLESDISTLTFQIGELSDLDIRTYSSITEGSFIETFSGVSAVASSSDIATSSGELVLDDTLGVYENSGFVYLGPITPSPLVAWQTALVVADTPVNTTYNLQFFTGSGSGPYTLIPDGDLPGNASGFTDTIVDISGLDAGTYPTIYAGVTLTTTNTSVTPAIDEISVVYRQTAVSLPAVDLDINGDKIIGTDAGLLPIYKYETTVSTDGVGEVALTDLEFDTYNIAVPAGYDIASACPASPFIHQAGVDGELELELVANAADTLRVSVVDTAGRALPNASVRTSRTGYDVTLSTDGCGQAFFTGGVGANPDYVIDVTAPGYVPFSQDPFDVSGDTVTTVTLMEL